LRSCPSHIDAKPLAVRGAHGFSAMADISMETSDADYASSAKSLWRNIGNRKH
jgi:DUF1680 family protein